MGTNNLTDTKKRVVRRVCRVATHAQYVASNFHNDIALVELRYAEALRHVCMRSRCECCSAPRMLFNTIKATFERQMQHSEADPVFRSGFSQSAVK